jgi:hypothetical protein
VLPKPFLEASANPDKILKMVAHLTLIFGGELKFIISDMANKSIRKWSTPLIAFGGGSPV